MLNPHRLRVLDAVIAGGSVQAAARNLHYSPATVSQHLKALAKETGLVLFVKDGRGIRPTPVAIRLADEAAAALSGLDRLERTVADLSKGSEEYLAIACFSSVAQAWIPDVVAESRQRYPHITVEISLNEPHDGHGRRPADLDIRNEPTTAGEEAHLDGYERCPLLTEGFVVVLPHGHRLAHEHAVPVGELRHEPWIDNDIYDSPTGRIIQTACKAAGFTPHYVSRLDDHHAAVALVEAGLGLTVLPQLAISSLGSTLPCKPLTEPTIKRRIIAHTNRDPRRRPLVDLSIKRIRATIDASPEGLPHGSRF